jgi:uncharacterized protein (DUF1919 family)
MLYLEKLKHALKVEQNCINKMYLNELILNWNKTEQIIQKDSEAPITALIASVSDYIKYLSQSRFVSHDNKSYGFSADHDVFKSYYLYDIIETLLHHAGIICEKSGLTVQNRSFHSGITLVNETFANICKDPILEITASEKCLHVGLEFFMQYKLVSKKNLNKVNLFIPLIVFYIEKTFNESSFRTIEKMQKDIKVLNPNAILFCITETVDKKLIKYYNDIQDIVYITRTCFKNDPYKPLQPQVFLQIYNKLCSFIANDMQSYEKIVPFGHINLVNTRTE